MSEVKRILNKRVIDENDFKYLLSSEVQKALEDMALRVNREHLHHFGKVILLYTPIYISNYCVNQCVYCSYNASNQIQRHQLTYEEIEIEAKAVSLSGIQHVLLLTGESETHTPFEYIKSAVKIFKKYFSSITIEIYPLSKAQYAELIKLGVDGLTIYQETYDRLVYKSVHPFGPKSHYDYRLEAPSRAAEAGMYHINIGALLGLKNWRDDVYALGLHLKELEHRYPESNFSVSIPRIRPFKGQKFTSEEISNQDLVQIMLALKLFAPKMGLNISTRESAEFREHLLALGVSKMSAGVQTSVGGHSKKQGDSQFEISDNRSVAEIVNMLKKNGYQPIMSDWI